MSLPKVGSRSPWGTIDHVTVHAPGIASVSTPRHGGFKLDRSHNAKVPAACRRKGGWYEEDCEYAISVLVFPEAFEDRIVEGARASLKNWYPEAYTAITGEPVALEDSYELRRRAFKARNADKHVVVSASGSGPGVPAGMVGVTATLGGERGQAAWDAQIHRLVTAEAYAKRGQFGYVLDGSEPVWNR